MPGEQELRRASDTLLVRLARLRELELQKRDLAPGSAEQLRVTREVEGLAKEVFGAAGRETVLAEQVAVTRKTNLRPISLIPPRDIPMILAEWRDAERLLAAEVPGTVEWETARADVERLRDEYRRAHESPGRT
jgi:hypothetical protein